MSDGKRARTKARCTKAKASSDRARVSFIAVAIGGTLLAALMLVLAQAGAGSVVPEPGTFFLLAGIAAGLGLMLRGLMAPRREAPPQWDEPAE